MMPALSIRAPWAWLIIHGKKRIENRDWNTGYRGRFLVHATGSNLKAEYAAALSLSRHFEIELPPIEDLPFGIIGSVWLEDITKPKDIAEWGEPSLQSRFYGWGDAQSKFWWHLSRPAPMFPTPCAGQLGWFFPI